MSLICRARIIKGAVFPLPPSLHPLTLQFMELMGVGKILYNPAYFTFICYMYVIDSAGFPGRSIYVDRSDFYGLSPEVEQKGRKNIIS